MRPTARQRVLKYVKRHAGATAAQIGLDLEMSAATVRHHLAILLSDGRAITTGHRGSQGRGRPRLLYQVPDGPPGDNLAMIADIMLDALVGRSPAARRAGVESLARGLMAQIGSLDRGLPLALRIGSLVERLNRLHYLSRWEAGARGPRIFFARCPYAAIIRMHPELCQMDAWALGGQTNLKAEQLAKIDPMAGAPTQCVFVLR